MVRLSTAFDLFSVTLAPKDDFCQLKRGDVFVTADSGHGKLVSVRITVLGCSGSVVGPDSPASGYLLTAPDTPPLVIDFGGGVLGALQRHADPNAVHVLLSHLHADHCLDLPGLFVWRRYHPTPAQGRALMYGPANTWARLGAASSPEGGEIDDFSDIFDIRHWVDNEAVQIGALNVEPRLVCHPTESYGMRITDPSGRDVRLQRRHRLLRRADRSGPRRRRVPVRGVVDARTRPAAEPASVGHRGGPGRRRRPAWASCC